jgi:hypothetical protein
MKTNLFKVAEGFGKDVFTYVLSNSFTLNILYSNGVYVVYGPVNDASHLDIGTIPAEVSRLVAWNNLLNMAKAAGIPPKKRKTMADYGIPETEKTAYPVLYSEFEKGYCG